MINPNRVGQKLSHVPIGDRMSHQPMILYTVLPARGLPGTRRSRLQRVLCPQRERRREVRGDAMMLAKESPNQTQNRRVLSPGTPTSCSSTMVHVRSGQTQRVFSRKNVSGLVVVVFVNGTHSETESISQVPQLVLLPVGSPRTLPICGTRKVTTVAQKRYLTK